MQRFLRHSRSLQREVSRVNSLFYAKMAVSNIRKNKKIFFPYIIMGIFSVMMYYMMVSLMNNDGIRKMPYSDNILALLPIGLWEWYFPN